MENGILVPYNESTKHIYEAFAKVAWEIVERRAREREAATGDGGSTPVVAAAAPTA